MKQNFFLRFSAIQYGLPNKTKVCFIRALNQNSLADLFLLNLVFESAAKYNFRHVFLICPGRCYKKQAYFLESVHGHTVLRLHRIPSSVFIPILRDNSASLSLDLSQRQQLHARKSERFQQSDVVDI